MANGDFFSGVMIAQMIMQVLQTGGELIARSVKNKQVISLDEAENVINKALNKAKNMGQDKLDELTNKLLSNQMITQSPTLKKVIDNRRRKLEQQSKDLRNDLLELDAIQLDNQMKYDEALSNIDTNVLGIGGNKNVDKYKENRDENVQKIQQIQEKIESKL